MNSPAPNRPEIVDDETPDEIEPGKRLIRVGDKGLSLSERIAVRLHKLAWRTPLHSFRLRGRYPLKLLAVPPDPVAGDARIGRAIIEEGEMRFRGETLGLETLDFRNLGVSPGFADHLQSFAWLRDLGAAAPRETAAPMAELIVRQWLAVCGSTVTEAGWRADLAARRILFWMAYAPLILSSSDLVYRSAVLNGIARAARHLDRSADKAPLGLPRITAWAGVVAAGLIIPGGDPRLAHGEAGLARALSQAVYSDGGISSRSPVAQLDLIEILSQLRAVYAVRRREPHHAIEHALARAVPALLGVTLGDGGLSSWQGGGPLPAGRVDAIVEASGVRTRPLRQARDWGYQRLAAGQTVVVVDAAPPPIARLAEGGCASTLAFELSDGTHRLIVNCGGARATSALPPDLVDALRTSAAHSTLIIADSNSTALHPDGSLGRGVAEVSLDRQETEAGSRIDVTHDGYAKRFGFLHRRQIALSVDGREVRGEDVLLPAEQRRRPQPEGFVIRFHLAPGVEATSTADGLGALLRIDGGALWQFRCRGGALSVEDSLWIDGQGRLRPSTQLVVAGETAAGGASVAWLLRRAG
ncbi:heparinase II/III family protein [Flavisphingomonas formosensis]|uniref:heparinase II/III family protein n=1 Tax=Flavisphingomonas formosensis TaxID=861534 RepID=UPI0012F77A1C|nr:heparinase II/III family protein [Sphingomonas formosensis]